MYPIPVLSTFILIIFLSNATFCKQCSVITMKGYDIVNIIQMSIIFAYPVIGRDWEIPMKLNKKIFIYIVSQNWSTY